MRQALKDQQHHLPSAQLRADRVSVQGVKDDVMGVLRFRRDDAAAVGRLAWGVLADECVPDSG